MKGGANPQSHRPSPVPRCATMIVMPLRLGVLLLLASLVSCISPSVQWEPTPTSAPVTTEPTRVDPTGVDPAGVDPVGTRPTTATPNAQGCPESGVTITEGVTSAAMGLRAMSLKLVNCGTGPYTVDGYPGVRVLDEDRQPLAVDVGNGTNGVTSDLPAFEAAPAAVTVRPGDGATVGLVWRNTYTDTTAPPALGRYLEISLAPGAPWLAVIPEAGARTVNIDLGSTGRLGVSPWAAAKE